jgi:hypothetical protein
MAGRFGVFIGFSDVFGRRSTSEALAETVATFRRSQLLFGTTRVALKLESWFSAYKSSTQDELIDGLFPISAPQVKRVRQRHDVGLVFTRLGLLYFTRQILRFSSELGRDISSSADHDRIGCALLMCNDLYLGYDPSPGDDLLQTAAGFLPASESLPTSGYMDEVARTLIMMRTILPRREVRLGVDYLDLVSDFNGKYGLTPAEFANLICGLVAHQINLAERKDVAPESDIVIRPNYFSRTHLAAAAVGKVMEELSSDIEELRSELIAFDRSVDFSPIQRRPLLRVDGGTLCLDPAYLFEKAGKAFFWVLRAMYSEDQTVERLMRFWGRVFESYHDWIWAEGYQGGGEYLPSPSFGITDNDEIADAALVEGDALVLFECKASVVTSAAKYSFDGAVLGKELDKKFVRDSNEKSRPKGVGQLARSIRRLAGEDRHLAPFRMEGVERIYSVLVVLDPIVERPFIRQYLNEQFRAQCANCTSSETITPLFAMHISDVERLLRYTNVRPFAQLIRDFARGNPDAKHRAGAIADYVLPELEKKGVKPGRDTIGQHIDDIFKEFLSIFKEPSAEQLR